MDLASLTWKLRRIRSMGAGEIAYRVGQTLRTRLERAGIGLATPGAAQGHGAAPWLAALPASVDAQPYLAAADAILAGRFDIFAMQGAQLGFPPRWNRDAKTGVDVAMQFGKAIDYRLEENVGDVKYLWEPNRHLQLVTLAQAWHLSGRIDYARGCQTLLDSWFEQCPYPLGPNWTSSLEHGIRLTNWAFAWHLLGGEDSPLFAGPQGAAFRERWLRSVFQHCHFIAHYFSKFSSANNHLLGEYMGLFVGSTTWKLWPESAGWQRLAQRGFEAQSLLQTAPDGVNREQATYYQHEVMDMMLICLLTGRANGVAFGTVFVERLQRMMEFLAAIVDRNGNVPTFGDADDALILRLSQQPGFNPYRSLLATGSVMFGRADFKAAAGACDDKTVWLLGDGARDSFAQLPVANPAPARRSFPDGGYHVLGTRRGAADEILSVFDCGPLGYLSIAAHGHADALSLTLSAGGRPLLVDPGTYAYHTQKLWRDHFRSTAAHNTVVIDGLDQSTISGNFMWSQKAGARCLGAELDGPEQHIGGEHDGYRRLSDPVVHRRNVAFRESSGEFTVDDVLICKGQHTASVNWQFSTDCDVTIQDNGITAVSGNVRLTMWMPDATATPILRRASDQPPGGWVSSRFDIKDAATCVIWNFSVLGETRLVTLIKIEFL